MVPDITVLLHSTHHTWYVCTLVLASDRGSIFDQMGFAQIDSCSVCIIRLLYHYNIHPTPLFSAANHDAANHFFFTTYCDVIRRRGLGPGREDWTAVDAFSGYGPNILLFENIHFDIVLYHII